MQQKLWGRTESGREKSKKLQQSTGAYWWAADWLVAITTLHARSAADACCVASCQPQQVSWKNERGREKNIAHNNQRGRVDWSATNTAPDDFSAADTLSVNFKKNQRQRYGARTIMKGSSGSSRDDGIEI